MLTKTELIQLIGNIFQSLSLKDSCAEDQINRIKEVDKRDNNPAKSLVEIQAIMIQGYIAELTFRTIRGEKLVEGIKKAFIDGDYIGSEEEPKKE